MGCKLTSNITKDNCQYAVAGIKAIYLFNYDSANNYEIDANGQIKSITLPTGSKAHKVEFLDNTASFTDELAQNGNGGKYRTHTLNFSLNKYDYEFINHGDALSLGKFVAVVVDKTGIDGKPRAIVLGRNNGLSATAFNYASGAADADAYGWTVTMAGTEIEIGKLLESETVITSIVDPTTVTP